MNEHQYVAALHRRLRKQYPDIDVWKINDNFAGGVPDAVYFGPRDTYWVEYKYLAALPKRGKTVIDFTNEQRGLSALQKAWLSRKHAYNISAAVIIGSPEGAKILPGLQWQTPITCAEFKQNLFSYKGVAEHIAHQVNIEKKG